MGQINSQLTELEEDLSKKFKRVLPTIDPNNWSISNEYSLDQSTLSGSLCRKLVGLIYDSLDPSNVGFVDRDTVLHFFNNHRFLGLAHLASKTEDATDELDHSEDERCSRSELERAMRHFSLSDLSHLIVDLCRVNPLKRPSSPLDRECDKVESTCKAGKEEEKESLDQSIKAQASEAGSSGLHDANRYFLTLCLFSALDTDMNKTCSVPDLNLTLNDEFFQQEPYKSWQDKLKQAVMEQVEEEEEDGRAFACMSPNSQSKFGLDQKEFQSLLESIDLDVLRQIFLHLVRKRAHVTLVDSGAMTTRGNQPCYNHKEMLDSILRSDVPVHDKSKQARVVHRQHQQTDTMLEINFLGQSLIQHDLREHAFGRESMDEMRNLIHGECVFSELETAIMTDPSFQPRRKTVFFHSAPVEVIDVLQEMGINLLAMANNHAGDLGPESVIPLQQAVASRGIVAAGAGENLFAAASPSYLKTKSGLLVGLVAHATKVPPGSEATADRPGVFSVDMKDVENCILDDVEARRALCAVATARCHASVVIAYQHNHRWSQDGAVNKPHWMASWKQTWARSLIDAGATIYVSHGQPRFLGIEIYNGCPLFFGLSSFIFQTKTEIGFYGMDTWMACIVSLLWSDRTSIGDNETSDHINQQPDPARSKAHQTAHPPASSVAIKLTPLTLNEVGVPSDPPESHFATRGLPRRASHEHSIRILNYIQELSRPFDTVIHIEEGDDGPIGWVTHSSNATAVKPVDVLA